MSGSRLVPLLLLAIATPSCRSRSAQSGQVFLSATDGSSVKLGGVEVVALAESDLRRALEDAKPKEQAELVRLRSDAATALAEASQTAERHSALVSKHASLSSDSKAAIAAFQNSQFGSPLHKSAYDRAQALLKQVV